MRKLLIPMIGLAGLIAFGCSGGDTTANTPAAPANTTGAAPAGDTGGANFATVAQIATANCMPCHGSQNHAGGLSLASYADVMKGGENGPAVVAGDPENSLLIKVLHGDVAEPKVPRMPLKKDPMSAADIQKIADWIKAGAKES